METFLTIYFWVAVIISVGLGILAFLDDGSLDTGLGVCIMLVCIFGIIRLVVIDSFIPQQPWKITEIPVQYLDYANAIGLDNKVLAIDNSLMYESFKKDQNVKFYKNFRPKNPLSITDGDATVYKAFKNGELVFQK